MKILTRDEYLTTLGALCANLYDEYRNNYLTIDLMAEHKGINKDTLQAMINEGFNQREAYVSYYTAVKYKGD